jgi:hypothetical protein
MNTIVKYGALIRNRVSDAIGLGVGSRWLSEVFRMPFSAPEPAVPALRLYSLPRGIRQR